MRATDPDAPHALSNTGAPTRTPAVVPDELIGRLRAVGLEPVAAATLTEVFTEQRINDALDALRRLDLDQVRDPAAWITTALQQNWDLDAVLQRRTTIARRQNWERQRQARDRADARDQAALARSSRWGAVISTALDDEQLTRAVETVTTPIAGLDRRSAPVARAQLVAWAVAVHRRCHGRSLAWALAADLEAGPTSPDPRAELPEPPATTGQPRDDLAARITQLLGRRPDLARVPSQDRHHPRRALDRGLEGPLDR